MFRRVAIALSAAAVGCGPESVVGAYVEASAGETVVAALARADGSWTVAVEDGANAIRVTAGGEVIALEVGIFTGAIELARGELAPGVNCRPCALLAPARRWAGPPDALREVGGVWSEGLRPLLVPDAAFRCAPSCRGYDLRSVHLDAFQFVRWIAPDAGDRRLIGLGDGSVFSMDATGSSELLCRGAPAPEVGFVDPMDDAPWIVTDVEVGRLDVEASRADPGGACVIRDHAAGPGQGVRAADGSREGGALEVVALTLSGAVLRYNGAAWTELGVIPPPSPERIIFSDVLRLGPGRALAVATTDHLGRVEAGQLRLEVVNPPGAAPLALQSLAATPTGIVLGADDLGIFQLNEPARLLETSAGAWRNAGAILASDGRLTMTSQGRFHDWVEGLGSCDPVLTGGGLAVTVASLFDSGAMLFGDGTEFPDQTGTTVTIATPKAAPGGNCGP